MSIPKTSAWNWKIYLGSNLIAEGGCWACYIPNENTMVYYPLTSSTQLDDMSWNNRTLSQSNTTNPVTFWTYQWVDCARFTWSYKHLLIENTFTNSQLWRYMTVIAAYFCTNATSNNSLVVANHVYRWVTWTWYKWWNLWPVYFTSWQWSVNTAHRFEVWTWWRTTAEARSVENDWTKWHIVIWTADLTWWQHKIYVDWVLKDTKQNSTTLTADTAFTIWWIRWWTDTTAWFDWWISSIIVENRIRSADDVTNFIKCMKSKYWIS